VNYAILPDGTRIDLQGNDEINLPSGGVFVLETPGGGGFS
jgi:5-oxoprolinase (ATP-hydrolysing)